MTAPMWCAVLLLWFGVSIAPTQAADALIVDAKGTCPDLATLNKQERGEGNELTRSDYDRIRKSQLQILRPQVALWRDPQLIQEVTNGTLQFGERVTIYRTDDRGGTKRYFVKATDKKICGWLLAEAAGGVGDPLMLTAIPGHEAAVGIDSQRSRLTAKAVIMSIRNESNTRMLKVPAFSQPFAGGDGSQWKIHDVGYFAIVDIYDFRLPDNTACKSIKQKDCFLLVGGTSSGQGGAPLPEYLGWVRGEDLALWPSALSLYYREGKTEARIYRNEKDAKRRSDDPNRILAYQEARHGEPNEQNIPRFPIANGERISRDRADTDDFIYEIVFAGEACEESGGSCRSGKDVLQDVGALGRQVYQIEGIDILFVIDGTRSMGRYYEPIIEAIENVALEATRQNLRMRFAVVVYGDYQGQSGTPETVDVKTVADFSKVGETNALQRLLRIREAPIRDAHGDLPEAPYAAIITGLQRMEKKWATDSLLRLVVWIGDHGNRDLGPHPTPTGGQVEEFVSAPDVFKTLKSNNAAFTALQVRGDRWSDAINPDFAHDAESIIAGMGAQHLPLRVIDTREEFSESSVRRAVESKLQEIIDTSTLLREHTTLVSGPNSGGETALNLRLPAARLANSYLQNDLKMSAETIRKVAGEVQQITTGVVYYDAEDPEFAFWLALRLPEFNELERSVGDLCRALESTDVYDELKDAMASTLEAVTFEKPGDKENMAEFLKKRFSIPKPHFSKLLDHTLEEFVTWWFEGGNTDEKRAFSTQVCQKGKMLDYVRSGKRVKLEDIEFNAGRWRLKRGAPQEEFAWDWSISSGIRYYFVPLEYLL